MALELLNILFKSNYSVGTAERSVNSSSSEGEGLDRGEEASWRQEERQVVYKNLWFVSHQPRVTWDKGVLSRVN